MMFGMSYDDFWYGDPAQAHFYYKAYRLKNEAQNQQLWLQGAYIYNAFAVVMNNSFSKGKKIDYPKQPYDLYPEDHKEEEAERQRREIIHNLENLKRMFDRNDNRKS